jgi:hypothetical protein
MRSEALRTSESAFVMASGEESRLKTSWRARLIRASGVVSAPGRSGAERKRSPRTMRAVVVR